MKTRVSLRYYMSYRSDFKGEKMKKNVVMQGFCCLVSKTWENSTYVAIRREKTSGLRLFLERNKIT